VNGVARRGLSRRDEKIGLDASRKLILGELSERYGGLDVRGSVTEILEHDAPRGVTVPADDVFERHVVCHLVAALFRLDDQTIIALVIGVYKRLGSRNHNLGLEPTREGDCGVSATRRAERNDVLV
jgi:hypothetical protein